MKHNTLTHLSMFIFLTLILSGCMMVGPDYEKPTASVQTNWLEDKDPNLNTAAPPVTAEWWKSAFNDPILNQLVETALAENLSLRSAGLRVLQARQQLAIAIGNQFPQQQQVNGSAEIDGNDSTSWEVHDLGFNLSWEADVWGRFKRQIESASASLDASVAAYDGVMVSLIAGVAQNYLIIRTTQQRLAVARKNLKLQNKSVRITTEKNKAGEVSSLDVEQARTLLYNTKASLSGLELSLQQSKNALAILLGKPPHDMSGLLVKVQPIPTAAPEIAVGMPQNLIRQRPDIRQAERQLAAQSAQIGYAVGDLYPHFGLGGSISTSVSTAGTQNFSDIFSSGSLGYNFLGYFQWNIFNYGRLKSNVRLQDAVFQQMLEDYRQTVLQAQGEVENAIIAFLKSREQLKDYQLATQAAQRAANISTTQYREGMVDFNTVINTLSTLAGQQDQLAAAQGTVGTNLVGVYKSLGGGWETRGKKSPVELLPLVIKETMRKRTKAWGNALK